MSTLCLFNEGNAAWKLHFESLKEAHPTVEIQAWSSVEVTGVHPLDDYKHTGIMDGNKGCLKQFKAAFPQVAPRACAPHLLMVCVRCCKCAHVSGRAKFRRAALLVDTTDGNVRVGVS